ncbi:MAG: type II toxin-antitoxin system RelE/ParE family toxin [bacterium]|nr:type II toxin-antitoxin system RelE/ParE family toxin [bacterium]
MSRARIHRTRVANQDLLDHYAYYAERDADLAERFFSSVEETLALLATQPEMGALHRSVESQLAGLRFLLVNDFPRHLIFYSVNADGIRVVRVVHGSRHLPPLLER